MAPPARAALRWRPRRA
ncbi:hypothetical protein SM139_3406, partial [Stenotrophomonas maltophilia]